MATKMKRFTISISADMDKQLKALKKERFFDRSKSEMIRCLLELGLNDGTLGKSTDEIYTAIENSRT